jgi:hypothetical protein
MNILLHRGGECPVPQPRGSLGPQLSRSFLFVDLLAIVCDLLCGLLSDIREPRGLLGGTILNHALVRSETLPPRVWRRPGGEYPFSVFGQFIPSVREGGVGGAVPRRSVIIQHVRWSLALLVRQAWPSKLPGAPRGGHHPTPTYIHTSTRTASPYTYHLPV